jgi:hypothetical protein
MSSNTDVRNLEQALAPVGAEVDKAVSTAAVALVAEADIPKRAEYACLTNGAQAIAVRFDSTDPTSTTGAYWAAGREKIVTIQALRQAKAIRISADSVVHISFWSK